MSKSKKVFKVGVGSTINISGKRVAAQMQKKKAASSQSGSVQDREKIAGDWKRVGNSIKSSAQRIQK